MIYFVQAGERGPIKIGFVQHPTYMDQRLGLLQTGNPEKLYVLTSLPGGLDRESELHARFAKGRMSGEWFRPDTPGLPELIYEAIQAETEQIVSGYHYCTWCKTNLVRPPRTRLCSDECERAKKRATAKAWKAARR
jgi:hypothetical protein